MGARSKEWGQDVNGVDPMHRGHGSAGWGRREVRKVLDHSQADLGMQFITRDLCT